MSYATLAEFYALGVHEQGLADIDAADIETMLLVQSSAVDDCIIRGGRYTPPAAPPYPGVLALRVCQLAALEILTVRGWDPDDHADEPIVLRWKQALDWCAAVAAGGPIAGLADDGITSSNVGPACWSQTAWGL